MSKSAHLKNNSALTIVAFAVIAFAAGVAATRVEIDTSIEKLLIAGDPAREANARLKDEFGNDEIIVGAFDLGHPFTADDLRKLARISKQIAEFDGLEEVLDLATVEDIRGTEEELDTSPLVDFDILDDARLAQIHERVRDHPLYRGALVSDDLEVLTVVAIPFIGVDSRSHPQLVRNFTELVEQQAPPWKVYVSGYQPMAEEGNRIVKSDLGLLTPIAILVIVIVVYIATRRISALVLLLTLIAWTELIALGWMGLSGTPLSVVTSAAPALVATLSSTYAIYALGLLPRIASEKDPGIKLAHMLSRPVLLSGLSTGIGFLSLRFIAVEMIGELGTTLAVTTAAAVAGTLLLLPAIVQQFEIRHQAVSWAWMDRWVATGLRLARRPWIPVGVSLILVMFSAIGATRIVADTSTYEYFEPDNSALLAAQFIDDRLSSAFLNNVVIRTDVQGSALEPSVMAFADSLVEEIRADPNQLSPRSFLDYILLMDAAMTEEVPRTVLPSRELAAQYLLLYDLGGDRRGYSYYLNDDRSALNIVARQRTGSQGVVDFKNRVLEHAKGAPEGVSVELLGSSYLYSIAMDQIGRDMVKGVITALVLIIFVMAVFLRSVKLALVAAVPNTVPLLICAGILGWIGIPLSMGTAVTGCVALGLAVDDTAHVLGHVRPGHSLEETYRLVGRPLILTTVALGLGFGVLMLSEFQPVAMLGAATAITLAVALLCDLLLLPALLVWMGYDVSGRTV